MVTIKSWNRWSKYPGTWGCDRDIFHCSGITSLGSSGKHFHWQILVIIKGLLKQTLASIFIYCSYHIISWHRTRLKRSKHWGAMGETGKHWGATTNIGITLGQDISYHMPLGVTDYFQFVFGRVCVVIHSDGIHFVCVTLFVFVVTGFAVFIFIFVFVFVTFLSEGGRGTGEGGRGTGGRWFRIGVRFRNWFWVRRIVIRFFFRAIRVLCVRIA